MALWLLFRFVFWLFAVLIVDAELLGLVGFDFGGWLLLGLKLFGGIWIGCLCGVVVCGFGGGLATVWLLLVLINSVG